MSGLRRRRRRVANRGGVRRFSGVGGGVEALSLLARLSPMFSLLAFQVFAASEIIFGHMSLQ